MNSYRTNGLSSTLPSAVAASIFIAGLSAGNVYAGEQPTEKRMIGPVQAYYSDALAAVQAAQALQVSSTVKDSQFLDTVSHFYSRLLSEQKPADPEIAALLSENLWDLYAD
jgi:hypothetical protein